MPPPRLTFFAELAAPALTALLQTPGVLADLQRAQAGVSLAILDLTEERARAVHTLTAHGIPVTAWLVLEPEDGYWLTVDNAALAIRRYDAVRAWSQRQGLQFHGVGLDIEVPERDAIALTHRPGRSLLRLAFGRRGRAQVHAALQDYHDLVARIRRDGLFVETYQFPLVLDERRARSTLLQRIFGFADVRGDREVLMLYRSVLPKPWGAMLIDAYGAEAEAIAVGITGGGVEVLQDAFEDRLLDLQGAREDLGRALRHGKPLYVFSLEGCVQAGFLTALCQAVLEPVPQVRGHALSVVVRRALRLILSVDPLWRRLMRRSV
jgi:hypothetical protein